jgi:hypothetical protein
MVTPASPAGAVAERYLQYLKKGGKGMKMVFSLKASGKEAAASYAEAYERYKGESFTSVYP